MLCYADLMLSCTELPNTAVAVARLPRLRSLVCHTRCLFDALWASLTQLRMLTLLDLAWEAGIGAGHLEQLTTLGSLQHLRLEDRSLSKPRYGRSQDPSQELLAFPPSKVPGAANV
jgi:hypothetical protein